MTYPILISAALLFFYVLVKYLNRTEQAKINGLPEVPGWPLFGSLIELGERHAKVAQEWSKKYGPVFQVRLGNKRIVFANSYASVRELWVTNQSALISRPKLHTFHTLVSDSSNFTIGTSPWDESCKRRRKAAATALNVPSVRSYMPIIDFESTASIAEILRDSDYGSKDVDPTAYFQRYALNTSLTLNYGYRIEGNVNDELLREITHVERQVSTFRSTSNNWEDYVPLLRILPKKRFSPFEYRDRRAKYMKTLLDMLKEKIASGTDTPCITGNILKDPEAKLNQAEIDSIGLTMVSAGLDTVPGNLIMGVGLLSTPSGRAIQQKAYEAIMSAYPDHDAWNACLVEEKVPYLTAFTKEVLRYFTVIPICLPRVSIKDITWNGVLIPAGTTFYMNAYAADYDEERFKDPHSFRPERYLNENEDGPIENEGTPHFAYGAGSRMCAGSHLANRELYVAFVRLICAFEMVEGKDETVRPVMDTLEANAIPTSLTLEPKRFKVGLKVRNKERLESWISQEALAR